MYRARYTTLDGTPNVGRLPPAPPKRNPFGTSDYRASKATDAERRAAREYDAAFKAGTHRRAVLQFAEMWDRPITPHQHGFEITDKVKATAVGHMKVYYASKPAPVYIVEPGGESHHLLPVGATFTTVNSPHDPPSQVNPECNQPHRIHWTVIMALDIVPSKKTGKREMSRYYQPTRYEVLSEIEYRAAIEAATVRAASGVVERAA